MRVEDFKRMFFTAYGRIKAENKTIVYHMLLPLILADQSEMHVTTSSVFNSKRAHKHECGLGNSSKNFVSIGKLAKFIDFFNYVPVKVNDWHHKNESSEDLQLYMGKMASTKDVTDMIDESRYTEEELAKMK